MTTTTLIATAPPMSKISRLAPLSGVTFVVLVLAHAVIALDGLPSIGAPANDIVRYVTDKQPEIQLGAYLQGLAMVAFLWFHASLFGRLRAAEHGPARLSLVAVAGAIGTVALLGIHISLMTVLAVRGDQLGSDVVTFAWVLCFLVLGMSSFTVATTMSAAGIVILRTRPLPGWLGIGALVDAALWLVGGAGAASTADLWATIGMIAFLLWLAWIATTSVVLVTRSQSVSRHVHAPDEGAR
ncbi:hypothetical protein ACIA03_22980 [Nocardioides sp. NPDC051685]|uniref:hypothetical protein n=1 Tax=Nocardioides sp. NPDC051685 TaxID=3364334 RepID=UPI00379D5813